jgi:hypothetical protein
MTHSERWVRKARKVRKENAKGKPRQQNLWVQRTPSLAKTPRRQDAKKSVGDTEKSLLPCRHASFRWRDDAKETLNSRHPASLRAFKPLAARPQAVAGSNPEFCFSEYFWIATSLRSSQ